MNTTIHRTHPYFPAFATHLVRDEGFDAERLLEVICETWKWQDEFEAFVIDRTKDLPKAQCVYCRDVDLASKGICEKCTNPRPRSIAQAEASHLRGLADFGEREERQGELRGMDYGTVFER